MKIKFKLKHFGNENDGVWDKKKSYFYLLWKPIIQKGFFEKNKNVIGF